MKIHSSTRIARLALALLCGFTLSGCGLLDALGIESASAVHGRRSADAQAIGAACRHVDKSLEACMKENRRASKAAVLQGWKQMDGYMREHSIASMPPSQEVDEPVAPRTVADADMADAVARAAAAAEHRHVQVIEDSPRPPPTSVMRSTTTQLNLLAEKQYLERVPR